MEKARTARYGVAMRADGRAARFFLAGLLLAASGAPDDAGESRKERWKARRLEKINAIEPYTISRTERAFLRLEEELGEPVPRATLDPVEESLQLVNDNLGDLPFPDYRDRLFTRIGSIRPGGGVSGGVHFVKLGALHPATDLDASAAVSVGGYQFYHVRFGNIPPLMSPAPLLGPMLLQDSDPWFGYVDVRYHDFRDETFFGPGGDSSREAEVDFRHQRAGYTAITGYRLSGNVIASARVGFSQNRVGARGDETEAAPRAAESLLRRGGWTDFVEVATSLELDFRDVSRNARRGGYVALSLARFDDTNSDLFRFTRIGVEGQGFVPLGSPQRTLAIRGQLSSDQADTGHRVPFYLQRTLGGNSTLRGFDDFRFRGDNAMHLSVEYRWDPSLYWGFSVFWDTGKVFRSFDDGFDLDGLENSFGIGTRLQTPGSTIFRIQVARSREGTRFHFAFGMVF